MCSKSMPDAEDFGNEVVDWLKDNGSEGGLVIYTQDRALHSHSWRCWGDYTGSFDLVTNMGLG